MLIQNYGLFWHIDSVHWGKPRNIGSLLGYRDGAKSKIVDFRNQTAIYALYADYDLVYVGQTGSKKGQKLFRRLKQHRRHMSGRWNRFSWFGTNRVKTSKAYSSKYYGITKGRKDASAKLSDALNHLEAILIDVGEPKLNRQGGKWGKAVHYKQYRDDDKLGPTEYEMLKQLHKKLKVGQE